MHSADFEVRGQLCAFGFRFDLLTSDLLPQAATNGEDGEANAAEADAGALKVRPSHVCTC